MVYAKEGFVLTKEIERLLLCEFCSVRYESIIDYETLLDDELKCEGCFGIVGKSIKLSENYNSIKKYEFDSFVIGCAVDKSLIKKDDELFNRYEKYIPLKNLIREEISKKITEELKIQENKEYPDITIIIDTKKNRFDLEIKSLYVLENIINLREEYLKQNGHVGNVEVKVAKFVIILVNNMKKLLKR